MLLNGWLKLSVKGELQMHLKLLLGLVLIAILSVPQVRNNLVSTMIGQMIIQMPLLTVGGYLFGVFVRDKIGNSSSSLNSYGIAGLLIALFTYIYWFLPRSIDAAVNNSSFELVKYVTVPLLIGLPLALSWGRLSVAAKGFVWANVISMCFVMGWFYANTPVRLCNNYLSEQQIQLGMTLMGISILLLVTLFTKIFFFGVKSVH